MTNSYVVDLVLHWCLECHALSPWTTAPQWSTIANEAVASRTSCSWEMALYSSVHEDRTLLVVWITRSTWQASRYLDESEAIKRGPLTSRRPQLIRTPPRRSENHFTLVDIHDDEDARETHTHRRPGPRVLVRWAGRPPGEYKKNTHLGRYFLDFFLKLGII